MSVLSCLRSAMQARCLRAIDLCWDSSCMTASLWTSSVALSWARRASGESRSGIAGMAPSVDMVAEEPSAGLAAVGS